MPVLRSLRSACSRRTPCICSNIVCRRIQKACRPSAVLRLFRQGVHCMHDRVIGEAVARAVLIPNINTPATPSNAPISCQCWCSVNPEAPRVVIESIDRFGGCIECAQQEIGFRPQGGLDPMQDSKRRAKNCLNKTPTARAPRPSGRFHPPHVRSSRRQRFPRPPVRRAGSINKEATGLRE